MDEPLPAMTGVVLELLRSMQELAGDATPPDLPTESRLVAMFLAPEFDVQSLVMEEVARALDV